MLGREISDLERDVLSWQIEGLILCQNRNDFVCYFPVSQNFFHCLYLHFPNSSLAQDIILKMLDSKSADLPKAV